MAGRARPTASTVASGSAALFPGAPDAATVLAEHRGRRRRDPRRARRRRGTRGSTIPAPSRVDRLPTRRGGFVDEAVDFDPVAFGIMPVAVARAEPDQLLALAVAATPSTTPAADAADLSRGTTGVILGRGGYLTPAMARLGRTDPRGRSSWSACCASWCPDLPRVPGPRGPRRVPGRRRPRRPRHRDRPGAEPRRLAHRQPPRPPRPGLHDRRGLRQLAARRRPGRAGSSRIGPVRRGARGRRPRLQRRSPFWSVFAQLGALSRIGHDPAVRSPRRRHADRRGHRRRRAQAPGRRRARRRPRSTRDPRHRRLERRPRRRP